MTEQELIDALNESDVSLSDDGDVDAEQLSSNYSSDSSIGSEKSGENRADSELSLSSSITPARGGNSSTRTRGSRGRGRGSSRGRGRGRGRPRARAQCQSRRDTSSNQNGNDCWTGNFSPQENPIYQPRYKSQEHESCTPEDLFKQYVDDQILDKMVVATNRTYIGRKGTELKLTLKELKTFIGMMFVMSAINLPIIRMYWTKKYGVPVVKNAMTRDRFYTIRTSLKVVYDSDITDQEKTNKIWKVSPLLDSVLHGCQAQEKSDNLSIDEMIIPFTGHCGIRQYCPGKPNPVGIKVFVLANPNGLVCDMVVYQGDSTYPDLKAQGYTLGESAILSLCETLVPGHHLYFDRYFSTVKLADLLLTRGFHATATIQKNRVPKNCIFSSESDFLKEERGTSETKVRGDGTIAIVRWLDNKPVTVISTYHAANFPDQCRRWSKRNRQYEIVSRPEVIKYYNQFMGGVDLADRMLSVCPTRARTRKWTIRFISHMFDLAVCNAWFQFKEIQKKKHIPNKNIPQLRVFKIELGEAMIVNNTLSSDSETDSDGYEKLEPKHSKRKVEIQPVPNENLRYHKADHLVDYVDKQNRCRKPNCKFLTTAFCVKCKIFLCCTRKRNCFLLFHKND